MNSGVGMNKSIYNQAFQQLTVGFMIIDHLGFVQFINKEFLKVSGFSEKEVIGAKASLFFDGNLDFSEALQREFFLKTKNNGVFPQWMNVSYLKDDAGMVTHTLLLFSPCQQCGMDSLTMLPNRYMFEQTLKKVLTEARENDQSFAVLFLDIDRFKFVNDTLGHSSGDILLKQVANRLRESLHHRHLISRIGGDEFVCVLKDLQSEEEADFIANDILKSFRQPFILREIEIFITTSIGMSFYPYDGDDIDTLMTNADAAMYRAKRKGKNQIEKAGVEINAGSFERLLIENSLRKALNNDELFLVFQPQLDLTHHEVIAFEALIRWEHPDLGIIPPVEFIPIAEETGLIIPIGDWVLRNACAKLKEWEAAGYSTLRISVNLSVQEFLQKGMVEKVKKVAKEFDVNPNQLELEITESMFMHDVDNAISIIEQLRSFGIRVSIDDFGTGFSSLNYLQRLPVNNLKIDRSFIKDIETNPNSKTLTNTIATLAHDLDLEVIVEGVETAKQLAHVKKSACDAVQGFYFSKPLKSESVVDFLKSYRTINEALIKSILVR